MQRVIPIMVVVCALTASTRGQDYSTPAAPRLYLGGDVGVSYIQDATVTRFIGAPSPDSKMKFDPGARFNVLIGWATPVKDIDVGDVALEVEAGVTYNTARDLILGGVSAGQFGKADVWTIPILVNGVWYPGANKWKVVRPFLGAGVGGHAVFGDLSIPSLSYSDSASSFAFAWQVKGGLGIRLTDNLDLTVTYRVLGTTKHQLDATDFNETLIHSLSVGAQFKF